LKFYLFEFIITSPSFKVLLIPSLPNTNLVLESDLSKLDITSGPFSFDFCSDGVQLLSDEFSPCSA